MGNASTTINKDSVTLGRRLWCVCDGIKRETAIWIMHWSKNSQNELEDTSKSFCSMTTLLHIQPKWWVGSTPSVLTRFGAFWLPPLIDGTRTDWAILQNFIGCTEMTRWMDVSERWSFFFGMVSINFPRNKQNAKPNKEHLLHAMIFFLNQKKKASESHLILVETYNDLALTIKTFERWF